MLDVFGEIEFAIDIDGTTEPMLAVKPNTQLSNNPTPCAVSADHILSAYLLGLPGASVQDLSRDAIIVLFERNQFGVETYVAAEAPSLGDKDGFELRLGQITHP